MRRNLQQWRNQYNWTQNGLAERAGILRSRVADLESGRRAVTELELLQLGAAFGCSPQCIDLRRHLGDGRPLVLDEELLSLFHQVPEPIPEPRFNGYSRLSKCRLHYPELMRRLDPAIRENPSWQEFLRSGRSDSRVETAFHLLELESGARFCRATLLKTGFDRFPVIDVDSRAEIGHRPTAALITNDWLLFPQVTVTTPKTFTIDALLVLPHPSPTYIDLEIDGPGHNYSEDETRTNHLGMPTIRLNEREILANVPLLRRLRALAYPKPSP
jgi:transcriptional regulator with XRE-family HTH domain